MKRLLLLICMLILCGMPVLAENYDAIIEHHTGYSFRLSGGAWRIYKPDGSLLMDYSWDMSAITESSHPDIIPLCDNLVAVRLTAHYDSPYGLADMNGNIVANAQYARVNPASCGLIRVLYGDRYGYLDESGAWALQPVYELCDDFSENLAAVQINGLWGFIDVSGSVVIQPQFAEARAFDDGLAIVNTAGMYGCIDTAGSWVIPPQYDSLYRYDSGLFETKLSGLYGCLDSAGQVVIPIQYESLQLHEEDSLAIVRQNGLYGVIDLSRNNAYVLQPIYSDIFRAQDGVYAATYNGALLHYAVSNVSAHTVLSLDDIHDLESYRNLSETLIPTSDEISMLQLTADSAPLPTLDAPAELLPLCEAIVRAVYPSGYTRPSNGSLATDFSDVPRALDYLIYGKNVHMVLTAGLSAEQRDRAARNGVELHLTPIGSAACVFFVHSDNPLEDISLEQIRAVYSGATTSWSELGAGSLGDILAYQYPADSLCQAALEWLMGEAQLADPLLDSGGGYSGWMMDPGIVSMYRNLPGAIGFAFPNDLDKLTEGGAKLLSVDGVAPTAENIESGAYPAIVPLYAVTRADSVNPNLTGLLSWLTSSPGQALLESAGYLPVESKEGFL